MFVCCCILQATFVLTISAADIRLAGADATWANVTILTNSVTCAVALNTTAHTLHAVAATDSALIFEPAWDAWREWSSGQLDIWIEVVANGSNMVTVLCGNLEAPSLTITCSDGWSLHPAGIAPHDPPDPASVGACIQALHATFWFRRDFTLARSIVRTRNVDNIWTRRSDLALSSCEWIKQEQTIQNWTRVGIALAGSQAALLSLRMCWAPDATIMIFK